jgi:hypothetical protein
MKTKTLLIFGIILFFAACRKNPVTENENLHSYSLLAKSIDEIRLEVTGKWQVQRGYFNGVAGPLPLNIPAGQGDIFRFLNDDTVKQTDFTDQQIKLYSKAIVSKKAVVGYMMPVYSYDFPTLLVNSFVMQEKKLIH